MAKKPDPRMFSNFEAFRAAYVEFDTAHLPMPTNYDDYRLRKAKLVAISSAADNAEMEAFEIYEYAMEAAAEDFDRGVGPGWD